MPTPPPDQAGALSYDSGAGSYSTVTPPTAEAEPINTPPPVLSTNSGDLKITTSQT
jgi:hypothetical protein